MRRFRRNGTPIGSHKVYAVSPGNSVTYATRPEAKVWLISGYKTWEEAEAGFAFEVMTGAFGEDSTPSPFRARPKKNYLDTRFSSGILDKDGQRSITKTSWPPFLNPDDTSGSARGGFRQEAVEARTQSSGLQAGVVYSPCLRAICPTPISSGRTCPMPSSTKPT